MAAAEDAGIDHTTAYARRRTHAEFASLWRGALAAHAQFVKGQEEAEIAALWASPPLPARALRESPSPSLAGGADGEELVVSGGQVRRVGAERWGKRKEAIFFDELAATANIHRSAAAAGVSYNAVHARRLKHPLFAAKWDAVLRAGRATIDMHLVEETQKSFDPAAMNLPEGPPRVTIDQAIKISQIGASKGRQDATADPFVEEAGDAYEGGMDGVYDRLLGKLKRIRERDRGEQLAAGWTYDESFDVMIPPGYVQGVDYTPKQPEPNEASFWDDPYGDGTRA